MNQIDVDYFEWLASQIASPKGKSFTGLLERMHSLEFVWTVPHDENRLHDGLDLRYEFLDGSSKKMVLKGGTILEVLVGLSRRVAFTAGGDEYIWAWRLIKNLRLNRMSDPLSTENANRIDDILEALVWRTYSPNGRGGFFPLRHPTEDQREVEIWYQMNSYVNEINSP